MSWERDCRPKAMEMLRLRTTATIFSTSGRRPMLANSSMSMTTGVGSAPS